MLKATGTVSCPRGTEYFLLGPRGAYAGLKTEDQFAQLFARAYNEACSERSMAAFARVTKTGSKLSARRYNGIARELGLGEPYPELGAASPDDYVVAGATEVLRDINGALHANEGRWSYWRMRTGTQAQRSQVANLAPETARTLDIEEQIQEMRRRAAMGEPQMNGGGVEQIEPILPISAPAPSPTHRPARDFAPVGFSKSPAGRTGGQVVTNPAPGSGGALPGGGFPGGGFPGGGFFPPDFPKVLVPYVNAVFEKMGNCEPEDWAKLPTNTRYPQLLEASGLKQGTVFGTLKTPLKMANWAVRRGSEWEVAMNWGGILNPTCGRDVDVPASMIAVQVGPSQVNGTPPRPGTPETPGTMPGMPIACGAQPMMTTRRTCGRGMVLGLDGLCYPKRMLAPSMRMNRSRKAPVTHSDMKALSRARRVQRTLERASARADKLLKPSRRRR